MSALCKRPTYRLFGRCPYEQQLDSGRSAHVPTHLSIKPHFLFTCIRGIQLTCLNLLTLELTVVVESYDTPSISQELDLFNHTKLPSL
jgi:hypothetical protein